MRTTLSVLAAFITLALAGAFLAPVGPGAQAQPASDSASMAQPKIIAVKIHADWCGFCKAMGPAFEDLQSKLDPAPVLYVRLDFTNDFTRRQAEYTAGAMNLDELWAEYAGRTGFILLLDAKTHRIIEKLSNLNTFNEMSDALKKALKTAS